MSMQGRDAYSVEPVTPVPAWDIGRDERFSVRQHGRDSRHRAMQNAGAQSSASTASCLGTHQAESAALKWLDRKPQEFVRMVRKSTSQPDLQSRSLPNLKKPHEGEAQERRKGEVRASDIIAAQKKADAEKEAKDLMQAERNADQMRQEHCRLVNQRGLKLAKLHAMTEKARHGAEELMQREGELTELKNRLAVLQTEAEEMERELFIELDTTPRYEHVKRRTEQVLLKQANACTKPQKELEEILGQMIRKGGSHFAAQFHAKSLLMEIERLCAALAIRKGHNTASLAQLTREHSESEQMKDVLRDTMEQRHVASQKLRGDKDAAEEQALQQVLAVRHAVVLCYMPSATAALSVPASRALQNLARHRRRSVSQVMASAETWRSATRVSG